MAKKERVREYEHFYAVIMTIRKDDWEHPLYDTMSSSRRGAINAFLVAGIGAKFIEKEHPWKEAKRAGYRTELLRIDWLKKAR